MRQSSPEIYASIVGVVQSLTQMIEHDKIAKEQVLVDMIDQINKQMKKEKAKKIKGHAKKIDQHIKRHVKAQSKEDEETIQGLAENSQKMHSLNRKNAHDFAKKNGHDDPEFLLKMLNAFRKE
jgi:biotin-(acetyl-CoA carboxylase) ligase